MEHVLVSVADEALAEMSAVVDALRRAGLAVTEVLPSVGVVTGTVDSDTMPSLSAVPGVLAVEPDRGIQLPPPDSPVQ
ncbi:hypothetical protein [Actinophytocola sp.]|uniref:hypothetical protein n=1 Tax=Actinophytocola sp. TaxID=1872138 RepID=UPI0025C66BE6|nr:hypothetical protein [Actinophytocola sp.]